MLTKVVLHLDRVDVVTTADVHLGAPPGQVKITTSVKESKIAGEQPTVGIDRIGGEFWFLPITAHHRPATQTHCSNFGVARISLSNDSAATILETQFHFDTITRCSNGVANDIVRIIKRGAGRNTCFSARVTNNHRRIEAVAHGIDHFRRNTRCARRNDSQ
ncbi:unannotated protein [freshwater metagenome]|uniref:Unannotated protein n=1 Tax=freshwater metagenome TaxID=449393 RepID=A0A6J6DC18_9ZZZZ